MLLTVGMTRNASAPLDPMKCRKLTIGQTIQYTSKEILGGLIDVFELVISGPFTSSL
jgi:hypothetical protein